MPRRTALRPRNWPVRWRLAAVSAGLTLAILVLFGVIIGNLAAQRVRDDFNREMKGAVASLASQVRIVDTITNTLIVEEPDLADFASPNDASVRIYDARGQQRDASPNAADLGQPVPGVREVGEMRVVTVALRSRQTGRVAGYVQYGRDEQHIDSTVGRLWLLIAAGVIGATVLASLAGVAIARRAMRPISSLTATAREIAETGDPSSHMPQPRADDEVGELARTLEQMLLSLDAARSERESALRRQREFVADASHELRTPLTSILANLELLQDSLDSPAQEDERAMVDSALRSSGRMSRLVGDLLLLARADAGRVGARTHCDLAEAAGHAAAEVAPTIGERELRLRSDRPLPVDGNPDELHRMVLNLLDNAARHTPPGSTIELRLRAEGRDGVVEVADDGPGVPEELREQIFERFVRGEGPADTAVAGGSGLGLAIVRAVAVSHGGSAEVGESDLGGALFRVRLPLRRSDSEKEIRPALDLL
ncbi:MAG TPA: HAMP domain-containing sensor histidine kinase [Solirubrobacterales bacterium]|nr:HAMP domain-containing sensor histidine kinase [Solirubrobacterales bacterium]